MCRRDKIKVFDHAGSRIVRRVSLQRATEMVADNAAFWLVHSEEIALNSGPGRAAVDVGKPDRSLLVGPSVISGAADGHRNDAAIVRAYQANHKPSVREANRET